MRSAFILLGGTDPSHTGGLCRTRRGAGYLNALSALPRGGDRYQSASSQQHGYLSDPTFEQTIGFQVVGEDGSILGQGSTIIEADWGERGPFAVDIEFTPPTRMEQGRIVVFVTSPRDGGVTHLASVEVTLGAAE